LAWGAKRGAHALASENNRGVGGILVHGIALPHDPTSRSDMAKSANPYQMCPPGHQRA